MIEIKYAHLLGREFIHGQQDCYSLVRDFFKDNFKLEFTDYARPDDWWTLGEDLYMENFKKEGFEIIDISLRDIRIADCFLVAIPDRRCSITPTNHAAIYVGNNEVIHHPLGGQSKPSPYRGALRNFTTHIVRHHEVGELMKPKTEELDIKKYILPSKRRLLERD